MDMLQQISKALNSYDVEIKVQEDQVIISNPLNKRRITVDRDEYTSIDDDDLYIEFTVYFITQHRHFSDLDNAIEYIKSIVRGEVYAIEFYKDGQPRFGGDIKQSLRNNLTIKNLALCFGYTPEYISQFTFTVFGWTDD